MGIYSTMTIAGEDALKEIRRRYNSLDDLPDETLENILFGLVGNKTLNNFHIVDDYDSLSEWDIVRYDRKYGEYGWYLVDEEFDDN